MASRHLDGRCGGAGDPHRDARRVVGLHLREGFLDLIEAALIVEGLVAGPFGADDVEEFRRAGIAVVLVVHNVAVAGKLASLGTGDDVDGDTAAAQLVERGELAGEDGRRLEAGAVGDQHAQPVGDAGDVLADLKAVRRVGMEGLERRIEAAQLMRLGDRLDVVAVHHRTLARDDLRRIVVADEADEAERMG